MFFIKSPSLQIISSTDLKFFDILEQSNDPAAGAWTVVIQFWTKKRQREKAKQEKMQ